MNNQQILMQFEQRFRNVFSLTDEEWQAFANQSVVRIVAKGDALFNAGDVADKVRFVCSGTLCNFYLTPDGNRRNKSFLQAGEVSACLSSFARGLPARFSCEALTDAVCVEISAKALKALSESTVGWQNAFLQMVTVLALKKEAREADLLLLSSTELYTQFLETHSALAQSLANYHIASYLGITEVSLSRIRAKLGVQHTYTRTT
ncbi:cAMP-binding protein [Enterovibrio norvegicus]|uniref:Crp/Fnr family transcriptional regulator n=1 Tax=Enterovibrio norvegicus TaxID=188144 RepID=UPI0002E4ECC1|nr:Crp/Fnr family transcriptional regulator [Enterovibrio norvegicus]MCC4797228.1 Crp/Fnr family transcriptional regulator [Enterovibrio norvegicus]OEF62004.1 cAMP-binding protein [Enterovibrio norvegicus]PMI26957.1 cAMP-binding protein [Enterovibrio norvegicus]PMI40076.1 cAMP-binding protein [Enterovibrio norvegicus]PMN56165.1 cAMP-binding protein [Enterovibrio norvegicus]